MSQGIKAWPVDDRPREKLWKYGEEQLSNSELLAILLRTGSRGVSAVDLSRKILERFGTFRNMSHTDIRDWKELKGLGTAKIAQLKAAIEIGRRFNEEVIKEDRIQIKGAKEIVNILVPRMRGLKIEVFKVAYLDNNNRIIDISDAAVGTIDHTFPIIREIIHAALQKFAKSIICVHNHPSDELSPSMEDKKFTRDLCGAGNLMEIKLLDHIIIAGDKYFSFADEGLI